MQPKLAKQAAVLSIIFFIAAMGTIIYLSAGKVITISDVAQDEVQGAAEKTNSEEKNENILTFVLGETDTSYLRIPLPEGCKAEDIAIENHYMDQELYVQINNKKEKFYSENAISGNRDNIEQGTYEIVANGTRLRFVLNGIFEYRTILENNDLYINFLSPKEMYEKIVVIDPACGGLNAGFVTDDLQEKEINLQIAKKLKEKLDKSDIKAYYTRMEDVNPAEENRIRLANETRADMYIRIQTDASEDTLHYGTTAVYNGDYFIPGFGGVELADYLEREVVTAIKGKALGLEEAQAEDYALLRVTIPAATIKTGCISNKQEAGLLGREDYQDKIATGIYNAIVKAYEENK